MTTRIYSNKLFPSKSLKIGIIGGGQLGKMMTQAAKKMGYYVIILDPTPDCPAAQVADQQIIGDFHDRKKIKELVAKSDVTTYDLEHIDVEILKTLNEKKQQIYPFPPILEIIQDKSKQKEILTKNNIPTTKYLKKDLDFAVKNFGFPLVQKACSGGYDGRGVFIIKNKNDFKNMLQADSFFEEFVDFKKELAINVARNVKGEIKCHPVVEMLFDKRANICDMVIAPARISKEVKKEAERIGIKTIKALGKGAIGIWGIEMFLTKNDELLVNEIAPRPHNSGHYTIEACITSQFEQHIRAILNLPLGSTDLLMPAVMVNILGEKGYTGQAVFAGIKKVLSISNLSLHIYGKQKTKPFRKMGHITILDKDIEKAIEKANKAKKIIRAISK